MKSTLSFKSKRTRIALAAVVVTGLGILTYSHHREQERLEHGINTLACSYYMASKTDYKSLGRCLMESERKLRIYKNIDDNKEKLEFLTNLCVTGSKSTVSDEECEGYAWQVMHDD